MTSTSRLGGWHKFFELKEFLERLVIFVREVLFHGLSTWAVVKSVVRELFNLSNGSFEVQVLLYSLIMVGVEVRLLNRLVSSAMILNSEHLLSVNLLVKVEHSSVQRRHHVLKVRVDLDLSSIGSFSLESFVASPTLLVEVLNHINIFVRIFRGDSGELFERLKSFLVGSVSLRRFSGGSLVKIDERNVGVDS